VTIAAHLAAIYALRCEALGIPGGATPLGFDPMIVVVKPGFVNIQDLLHRRPGQIVRVDDMDAIQFPMGTWMAHAGAFDIRLWNEPREPLPQISRPTYGQKTTPMETRA